MKCFMVLSLFVALAFGDVSHLSSPGYNYPTPQTSYGSPVTTASPLDVASSVNTVTNTKSTEGVISGLSHSVNTGYTQGIKSGLSQEVNSGFAQGISQGINSGLNLGVNSGFSEGISHGINSGLSQGVNSGFTQGINQGLNYGYANGGLNGFDLGASFDTGFPTTGFGSGLAYDSGISGLDYQVSGLSNGFPLGFGGIQYQGALLDSVTANSGFGSGYQGLVSNTNAYQTSNDYNQYAQKQQPQQVFKHVYVHSAPEEPQVKQYRPAPILPPPQKHYKIIFIKAPTPATPATPVIPVQPQNEEKTIVYVLSKTPEEQAPVVVPQAPPTPPSKPEVFFIKYDAQKENSGGLQNTINEYVNSHPGLLGAQESITTSGVIDATSGNSVFGTTATGVSNVEHVSSDIGVSGVTVNGAGLNDFGVSGVTVNGAGLNNFGVSGVTVNGAGLSDNGVSSVNFNGAGLSSVGSTVATNEIEGNSQYNVHSETISSSQGLPHASYGVPTFRPEIK